MTTVAEVEDDVNVDTPSIPDVRGMQISVIGAARSGVAVAELLSRRGAAVFVSDSASAPKIEKELAALRALGIPAETGAHTQRVLAADLIVISPGVPSSIPVLREATGRGIRLLSELEVASWFCRGAIVAITGTNGKTTTTTLLGRMLEDARKKCVVAGNIGKAFSTVVDDIDDDAIAVLEVSSFQLDHVDRFRPKISVILNITPDHLDRYDHDFGLYQASKARVFAQQREGDVLIYNDDDPVTRAIVEGRSNRDVQAIPFSAGHGLDQGAYAEAGALVTAVKDKRETILATKDISIRGTHNLYNSMASALAAQLMGAPVPSIRATLKNFKGVEHRLEFVRDVDGVRYINDSKATNVDSVWYALQAFEEPLIVLIGGRDKGNDYTRLLELVRKHVKGIVAIGESAGKVIESFSGVTKVVRADSMEEAVRAAKRLAVPGDVVLLSPACASFDWFRNYEHRGEVFKQLVNAL